MASKVLVTGGAGFIGSHVVDACVDNGYDVAVVDDLSTGRLENVHPRARFYQVDLNEPSLAEVLETERPQVVVHHAAQISVKVSMQDPYRDAQVNVLGSLRLFQLCHQSGVRKVVFASSGGAIYGDPQRLPCDEDQPTLPLSPYGIAKMTVEHYLRVMCPIWGLDYTILRYGNVYGPRQDPQGEAGVVAIFTGRMLRGEPVTINGDGEQTRDYVYVGDLTSANLLALDKGSSEACNIGSGAPASVNEVFAHLARLTGYTLSPHHGAPLSGEVRHIYLSVDRAWRVLGWQPTIRLGGGLARTVDFFRSAAPAR
ncbi:MAG: NAD-dependent epimerase/dehydratase family protein [Chloroflexi bacterium]|nr:NAD-dependent epimerase/dehydratase family protein [Chloroflexota bacterium]